MIGKESKEQEQAPGRPGGQNMCLQASYTVEASLLMTLILPLLIVVLIVGFYLHDRACLQGAACETAAMGSNLMVYDSQSADITSLAGSLMSGRMLWTKHAAGSASASRKKVSAQYGGTFPWPGMLSQLWRSGSQQVQGSWSRTVYQPAALIRKARGVEYVVDLVRRG